MDLNNLKCKMYQAYYEVIKQGVSLRVGLSATSPRSDLPCVH